MRSVLLADIGVPTVYRAILISMAQDAASATVSIAASARINNRPGGGISHLATRTTVLQLLFPSSFLL